MGGEEVAIARQSTDSPSGKTQKKRARMAEDALPPGADAKRARKLEALSLGKRALLILRRLILRPLYMR